jgi:peroxiredoxin
LRRGDGRYAQDVDVSDDAAKKPSTKLATTSVVIGVIALPLSVVLIGGALGLGGIALGARHLARRSGARRRAWLGIVLSAVAVINTGMVFHMQAALMRRAHGAMARWEGVASPAFVMTTLDGTAVDSTKLHGKRVLLDFWATWCAPCRMQMAALERLVREKRRDDVVVLGISDEDAETLRTFLAKNPVAYPIASVERARRPAPYSQILAIPSAWVIDRNGVIQFGRAGVLTSEELERLVWDAPDVATAPKPPPRDDS